MIPYNPIGPYPTLWSGTGGPRWCWDQPRVRRLFDRARLPGFRIHTDGSSLAHMGPKLTQDIRAAHPGIDPWWAIAGDADGPNPTHDWIRAAHAAVASGVRVLELNCEAAWKTKSRGATLADREKLARDCVAAVHEAEPALILAHTAYREPHDHAGSYPYRGFLGLGTLIKFHCPQMYGKTAKSAADRADKSCKLVESKGLIQPGLPVHGYFSTTNTLADLCDTAIRYPTSGWWVLRPGDITPDSYTAIVVLSELVRRGYHHPGGIADFQRAAGLKPDGVVGEKTLAALGITFGMDLPA